MKLLEILLKGLINSVVLNEKSYEFKTLQDTSFEEIFSVVKSAFTNYYVVVRTTEEHLKVQHRTANVDYAYSIGTFVNDKLVGFLITGFDYYEGRYAAYNAGTGVVEQHRGRNLTKKMHDELLRIIKTKNVERIYLEVIEQNLRAFKVYSDLGYKAIRTLDSFNGRMLIKKLKRNSKLDFIIENFDKAIVEPQWWDFRPTWQNSTNSLSRITNNVKSVSAYLNKIKVAYIIYNQETGHIHQIAVSPDYRRNYIGSNLLKFTSEQIETHLTFINIDSQCSSLIGLLNYSGLEKFVSQKEMFLEL